MKFELLSVGFGASESRSDVIEALFMRYTPRPRPRHSFCLSSLPRFVVLCRPRLSPLTHVESTSASGEALPRTVRPDNGRINCSVGGVEEGFGPAGLAIGNRPTAAVSARAEIYSRRLVLMWP